MDRSLAYFWVLKVRFGGWFQKKEQIIFMNLT